MHVQRALLQRSLVPLGAGMNHLQKRRPCFDGACRDAAAVLWQKWGWLLTFNNDRSNLLQHESAVQVIARMFGRRRDETADRVDAHLRRYKEAHPNEFWMLRRERGA